ncbi:hypothetical protein ACMGDK_11590 [Chryseobacterium sp. DT-3]|uniref:hypothetical protein n=1 Tax=Chryseobacterium sp. DT-3 TaxID=3396164 RepID=UPI003F1B4C53
MEDLIKALQILIKYGNPEYPTQCEHDQLNIVGIDPESTSKEDVIELERLGFYVRIEGEYYEEDDYTSTVSEIYSFKYGSV